MIRKHFFFKILLPYIAVWGVLFYSLTAFATVGITPATGGSAISADTTGGAYTILTGPIIQEGAFRDFPATKTFILTAPGGFAFNTGATVTATITRTAGTGSCFAFTSATATPTASTITFTLNARDGAPTTTRCRVVFSNIQVRPTAGTPLASGNITKSGTAAVSGITNGVTNLGTLTEVVGVKNKLAFTTQPSVTASVNTDFAVKPVIKLQDQFGNTVTTDNASAIARVAVLGTQACGGTAGSGTVSSTPTDGAAVTSGIMTYTAMRYSVAENIKICATSAGVTSALSGAVTVNTITTTTTLGTSQSPQTYGTPVIFTATVTPAFGGAPSGTVTFKDGATIIGTGTLNGANPGVASYGTSTLSFSGSPHSITAVYNGDNSFSGSTSGAIFQTITAKALTVIGMTADNKEYDGGITAMLSGGTLNGIVGSDVVSINTRAGSFSDKFAGIGKTVNVTSVTLAGPDSSNYTVALPVGISANITAKALTVTGMTATNKEYDGFNTVALSGGTLVGIINPDVVSINTRAGSFADKFAGIGKTVSVTAIALTGADSSNYTTTLPTGITADITEKNITVVGVSANDKTYDGNATAVLNTGSAALVGIISGDTVVLDASVATASFDSPDIGLNKPITVSGLALSGMDAPNYNLSQPIGITADITNPVPITTSITPASKETGDAGFTLTVNGSGFISGSVVKFNGSSRMTSFVNSGSLTAEILAGDVATATSSALITVFNPTPGGGTSNAQTFVVAHAATQFVILPSLAGTVDASTTVTVQAQKANGSVDTTYQDDVTLNATGSATGEGLVNIVDGVGVLSLRDTVAETVHLTLADSQSTGLAVTSSQDIVFVAGAVTQFVLNDPGNMNARTRLGYQLTRKDQYGNAVSAGILTAYLYSSSLSADHKFYGDPLLENIITSVSFSDGSAAASFWYYDDMPGVYDISVSDNTPVADGNTGIDDATRSVTVIPVAVKFVIITATSTSVDLPLTVTVQAQKTDNTVDVSFQDDVTLNATGSVTGEGTVNMVNGVGTKQLSNMFVENVVLSLADSQSTGLDVSSTANVAWVGGVITQFSLTHPGTLSAGNRAHYAVSRKDQYGNYTSLGDVTARLYSSSSGPNKKFYDAAVDGNAITSIIIPSGSEIAEFWYYDELPGFWSITASDNIAAPDGPDGISDFVDVLSVTPGSVGFFTLNNPGDMTAGTRLGYTVTRKDQFGNLVTSGDTTAYLFTSAGALGLGREFYDAATAGNSISSLIITNGVSQSSFWYHEEAAGSYTITTSDNAGGPDGATGISDGTASVQVNPAPIVATRFVILPASGGTVDAPVTITIQAQDGAGNIDTSATSSVTLITDGSATGAGLVTMSGGIGTIQISDHNAETVHLSLSDTQSTGLDISSAQDVIFSVGEVAQFFIDNPGDTAAGSRLGLTITRKDQFGNLITSGVTTAYLYSSSVSANKKFYDASSGGSTIVSVNILGGQSTAQFWYYDELAGSATVTVSDNATNPDGVSGIADAVRTFSVNASAIAKFTMDNPGNMTAGTRLGYTITRKDAFDNPITSGIVSAYLYSSAEAISTKFYDAASGGFPTTLAVFADGNSEAHFWYYEEAPGTWVITASDGTPTPNGATGVLDAADSVTVTLATITATRFVIGPVSNSTVNMPVTVTIRAEDDNGNVDTSYNHNVTLALSGSATGGGVITIANGVGIASINDAVAETVTLSLLDNQSTGLNVSSSQTMTFSGVYAPPSSTGGGSGVTTYYAPLVSGVRFEGKAFPGAALNIVAIGGADSIQNQTGIASANGNFALSFQGLAGGARSYGIVGIDKNNNATQVKIFDANMANALLQLDVNGILLSPTLGLSRGAATKGDVLGITGFASPLYKIEVQVDNQPTTVKTTANAQGAYKALVPTEALDFGSHTIRTRQISPSGLKSDYSPQEVFSVVNIFTPNMDFNNDGSVNIQDWSVFVARWQSENGVTRSKNDLNGDGKIDVQDLSIFVRTLKVK